MHTQDQGNNETISRGLIEWRGGEMKGQFLALTFCQSKWFKTRAGAEKWLAKRGLNPDGSYIAP